MAVSPEKGVRRLLYINLVSRCSVVVNSHVAVMKTERQTVNTLISPQCTLNVQILRDN